MGHVAHGGHGASVHVRRVLQERTQDITRGARQGGGAGAELLPLTTVVAEPGQGPSLSLTLHLSNADPHLPHWVTTMPNCDRPSKAQL